MNIFDHFSDWINQEIGYIKVTSRDIYNDPVEDEEIPLPCYMDETIRNILDRDGKEIVSRVQVYVEGNDTTSAITVDDKVSVDDITLPIKAIGKFINEKGVIDYVILYL